MSDRAESLRTLEPVVDAVRDPALVLRGDASAELANPALCTHTGLARDRLLGYGWLGAIYQADAAASPAYWLALLARGRRFDVELRLRRYDGTFAPLHVEAVPLSKCGERWFVTAAPIATRREADEPPGGTKLFGDKALCALMFHHLREAAFVWLFESRARILLWNRAAEQMYGYSRTEVLDRAPHSVLRTVFPVSFVHVEAALRRDGRWTGELGHYTRAGELLHVDVSLELVELADGRRVVLESCRDITARQRDEQSLLEVQTRLRLALAASGTGIWDWQIGSDRIAGSPETFAIVGAAPNASGASREDFARRIHPDDRKRVWAEVARSVEDGRDLDCEFRIVRDDGQIRQLHDRALVERDASGKALRLIGTVRDITAERELSERLTASEARFRALANAMPQLVWTCDAQGEVDWINQRWTAVTGTTLDDAWRAGWAGVVHPEDLPGLLAARQVAIERGEAYETEYRLRCTDGAYRWFLGRAEPMRDEHGAVARWFATATDIDQRVRDEARLRASERRFQIAFESNPQPTAITRLADGVYLAVNAAFLAVTGYARDEVLGRSGADLGLWATERRAQLLDSLVETGQLRDTPFQIRTKDGRIREVLVSSERIELDGVDCLLNVVTDVTCRRAAEAALRDSEEAARIRAEEMEALIASVPAAIWITRDRDARFVDGSIFGYELLRMPRSANLSKSAGDPSAAAHFTVWSGGQELAPEDLPLQLAARTGRELRGIDQEIRFSDGTSVELYGNAVPLLDRDGQPRGAIAAFVDVTPLRTAEAALRDADRRKDEFLAMLAHELRNPLAPILTAVHLMKERGDVATPRQREVIERQARHLVHLVDDLLDIARVSRGKIDLQRRRVELAEVVDRAVEATRVHFERKGHELAIDVPREGLCASVDEVRFTQIVSNLLTNAARYTPEHGHVAVTAAREGGDVVIRVRDDGIGIARDLLPHVFDMFVQGQREPDRTGGGLGLGLTMVRLLTELHGGSVTARSDGPGLGTEITVRVAAEPPASCAAPEAERALPPPPPARPAHHRRRVLVVDDNVDAAALLAHLLRSAGHEVEVAHRGHEALDIARRFAPEVAILDIGLPDLDGHELAARLRGERAEPALIALTGYGHPHDRQRSAEAGFRHHLVKPVDPHELLALIAAL